MLEVPTYRRGVVVAHALVDDGDADAVVPYRWHLAANGYPSRGIRVEAGRKTIARMHRLILGLTHGDRSVEIDHVNGDKLDNRRANLRAVSHPENMANRSALNSNNTSGYRGVYWDKSRELWVAAVKIDGRSHHVGRFQSAEAANSAAADYRRRRMPTSETDRLPSRSYV